MQTIYLIIIITAFVTIGTCAPFTDDTCCDDTMDVDFSYAFNYFGEYNTTEFENLLYIPFHEITIRDFGIHKYVLARNIKSLITYHTDSHLINIIFKSLNQSAIEISKLVYANIDEFDKMSQNEFVANFLDFWCAYRIIQLSKFTTYNLDILANMFKDIVI